MQYCVPVTDEQDTQNLNLDLRERETHIKLIITK